jgi:hypothetical protein
MTDAPPPMRIPQPEIIRASCKSCMYWVPLNSEVSGMCRRYAPQAAPLLVPKESTMAVSELRLQTVWPSTGANDGCGDFVARKT